MTEQTDSAKQTHSDEMQEIIGAPPSWLLQWGITIFLAILAGILSLSAIIAYPDVINTQLKIRSVQQPITISSPQKGHLVEILRGNNDMVKERQALAIIATAAGPDTVLATCRGTLSYLGIIHKGMPIDFGQPLFTISDNNTDFFGELVIPQNSIAKVQAGQRVIIKLNSYPYQEYGMLEGRIKYITEDIRNKGLYLAEVELDDIRFTSMHKQIHLKSSMVASADIITQNSSLLKRLLSNAFRNINHSN